MAASPVDGAVRATTRQQGRLCTRPVSAWAPAGAPSRVTMATAKSVHPATTAEAPAALAVRLALRDTARRVAAGRRELEAIS